MALSRVRDWFEYPHRFHATKDVLSIPGARVLDVGCGNHSPSLTRRYFPTIEYWGVDRDTTWALSSIDLDAMDRFVEVDLDDDDALLDLPAQHFDVVLCSHVLEHVVRPAEVVARLAAAVRPGGVLFLEVPARRSLRLPSERRVPGVQGCLNFWDDPTHRQWVDLREATAGLGPLGFEVTPVRPRRMARRVVLFPAYVAAGLASRRYVPASVLWDVVGFAELTTARRGRPGRSPAGRRRPR